MEKYDSIINLPHHVSEKYPQMPMEKRAAQFQPFMALTGFSGAVAETARRTDSRKDPAGDLLQMLDERISELQGSAAEGEYPEVTVTYFQPDDKKSGGAYASIRGRIQKIDGVRRILVMDDGSEIGAEQILDLQL